MRKPWKSRLVLGLICLGQLSAGCDDGGDDGGTGGAGASSAGTSSGAGTGTGTAGTGTGTAGTGTSSGGSGGSANAGSGAGGGGTAGGGAASGGGGSAAGGTATSGAGGSGGSGGSGGGSSAAMLSDAQILGVLDTLNLGEVAEAEAAEPRLMAEDIQDFAEQMIEEHGAARQQVSTAATSLMLQLASSPVQMQLDMASDARVAAIMSAEAAMVDEVYISGQVMAHSAALAMLGELATAADAQALKDLIMMLRSHVEDHLEEAMMLDD